ncbi:hypothetical protein J6590_104923 [Homalodisca vitripennis]|nr:hypothetical protein J6590_104923 [Homalodisca vitripennis]
MDVINKPSTSDMKREQRGEWIYIGLRIVALRRNQDCLEMDQRAFFWMVLRDLRFDRLQVAHQAVEAYMRTDVTTAEKIVALTLIGRVKRRFINGPIEIVILVASSAFFLA